MQSGTTVAAQNSDGRNDRRRRTMNAATAPSPIMAGWNLLGVSQGDWPPYLQPWGEESCSDSRMRLLRLAHLRRSRRSTCQPGYAAIVIAAMAGRWRGTKL
jgi:hypothetical protein